MLYLPVGVAHGFLSLTDKSCLVYKTDAVYAPECDAGIHWNSFGFDWPLQDFEPILSDRDRDHPALTNFNSPF